LSPKKDEINNTAWAGEHVDGLARKIRASTVLATVVQYVTKESCIIEIYAGIVG